jgi:hypothetical protein
MTDLWMPDVPIAKIAPRLIDATGRFISPFTGATRSITRTGDRWGFRLDFPPLFGLDRARLESLIAKLRGAANRVLFSPIDMPLRGSFPAGEKFTNNNFANGATAWNVSGALLTAVERRLRFTFSGAAQFLVWQNCAIAANMPHVARYFLVDGKGTPLALAALTSYIEGTGVSAAITSVEGLTVVSLVPDSASGNQFIGYAGGVPIPLGQIAGNYAEAVWTSLTQCMLVDNGPNLLLNSNNGSATGWGLSADVAEASNVSVAAPDGTLTARQLKETTTNNAEHYMGQPIVASAATGDFSFSVYVYGANRNFALLRMGEGSGPTYVFAWFNLTTGAVGTTSSGANWTNIRTSSVNLGNSWWRFTLTARKTSASTSVTAYLETASADNVYTYVGTVNLVAFLWWHASLAASGVPVRDQLTAGSANPGILQTGSALYVKGAPPSVNGLLLVDDWFEVNKELKKVTASLNSDASGLGYLQFSPPIRTSPNDNDPVIVNMPMGRFIFSATETGWLTEPGLSSTASIDLIEAA